MWKDSNGNLYGRVTWTDEGGKVHDKKRKSKSGTKKEARDHIKDLMEDIDERDETPVDGATLTIKQLADYYKTNYAIEAEYDRKGIKKAGMRSWKDARRKADALVNYFGPNRRVRSVTYGDLAAFKATRLRTPAQREKYQHETNGNGTRIMIKETWQRSIASVHREIEVLQRMFAIAMQHRWIRRNPFKEGDPLIEKAEETERERIATKVEEQALLDACDEDERRKHLKPLLICAFATGCRPIELFQLRVKDVDFDDNSITVISYKGKRMKQRAFDLTTAARAALTPLCCGKKPDDFVFTYKKGKKTLPFKSVKRSFATAKRIAGLEGVPLNGFRLYDARHTATTRLIKGGMPIDIAGKLLGHSQPRTTWRYLHPDKSSRRHAAKILEQHEDSDDAEKPRRG
ncbi:MAG TPA: site-specific integrase [Polyangiaceae bacterium]|nr:site-specific integrase [Polyangiaceae bacterium]